jgi:hypothetical protein
MIVCCGFVNSGTRLLHKIVQQDLGVQNAIHRSYPHWDDLWSWRNFPTGTKFIIIWRRPDVAIPGAVAAMHPGLKEGIRRDPPADREEVLGWYLEWLKVAASIPDAYWLTYEALVADPQTQIDNLARWLGVARIRVTRQIRDENRKWLLDQS